MKAVFVAGTDTGAGKTLITGLMARYLKESGFRVITQKWVQTGSACDINAHRRIAGISGREIGRFQSRRLPYAFKLPASPHLAAKMERKNINSGRIKSSFRLLLKYFDFVIVEGSGGILVPLNEKKLAIDIVAELGLAVLLVARNRLGAINHTLLTVEALKARKIRILGIIFSNSSGQDRLIIEDNPRIIKAISKEDILGVLPYRKTLEGLYKYFRPIGRKICKKIIG